MTEKMLEHEDFAAHVGTDFEVIGIEPAVVMTLVETKAERHYAKEFRVPFSLQFKSTDERVLAQQMIPLRHEILGDLAIFMGPIGRDESGVHYEAVFN